MRLAINRRRQDYTLVAVASALVLCHVSCWSGPGSAIHWNKDLDATFQKARTNAHAWAAAAGIVLASNVVTPPIAYADNTRLETPAETQSTVLPEDYTDEDSSNVGSAQVEQPIQPSQSQATSTQSIQADLNNEEVETQPTIRSIETTQVQMQVETKALVSTLESNRGDLSGAIASLARKVPSDSIQLNPPLANPRLVKQKPAPLVDVDQLIGKAWQSVVKSMPTTTNKDDKGVPLFIPIPNQPSTDWWDQTYTVTIPTYNAAQQQQQGDRSTTTTSFTYSNGQATQVAAATTALSYPISYAYYQYELDQEEKKAQAKKAAAKAKKAAAAAARKKKKSGKDKEAKAAPTKKGPKGADSESQPFETKSPKRPATSKVQSAKDATFEKTQAERIQKQQTTSTKEAPEIPSATYTTTAKVDALQRMTPSAKAPQQDGGMDAYAKAYATMLAASTSSPSPAKQPSTRMESPPPLPPVEASYIPTKPEAVTISVEQPAPDQVIATSLPLQGAASLENGRSPMQPIDNGGMSAYEKAYAAMAKGKI